MGASSTVHTRLSSATKASQKGMSMLSSTSGNTVGMSTAARKLLSSMKVVIFSRSPSSLAVTTGAAVAQGHITQQMMHSMSTSSLPEAW